MDISIVFSFVLQHLPKRAILEYSVYDHKYIKFKIYDGHGSIIYGKGMPKRNWRRLSKAFFENQLENIFAVKPGVTDLKIEWNKSNRIVNLCSEHSIWSTSLKKLLTSTYDLSLDGELDIKCTAIQGRKLSDISEFTLKR